MFGHEEPPNITAVLGPLWFPRSKLSHFLSEGGKSFEITESFIPKYPAEDGENSRGGRANV